MNKDTRYNYKYLSCTVANVDRPTTRTPCWGFKYEYKIIAMVNIGHDFSLQISSHSRLFWFVTLRAEVCLEICIDH